MDLFSVIPKGGQNQESPERDIYFLQSGPLLPVQAPPNPGLVPFTFSPQIQMFLPLKFFFWPKVSVQSVEQQAVQEGPCDFPLDIALQDEAEPKRGDEPGLCDQFTMVPAHSSTSVQVLTILMILRLAVDLPRADVKPAALLFLGPPRFSAVGRLALLQRLPVPQKAPFLSLPISFSPLGCHPSVSSSNVAKRFLAPSLALLSCSSLFPLWHDGGQLRFFPF